jgi:hypothetical protein
MSILHKCNGCIITRCFESKDIQIENILMNNSMISEYFYLFLITDFCKFFKFYILEFIDTSGKFEEFFSSYWSDSRDLFENIFFHCLVSCGSIRRYRESMGLITRLLKDTELRCAMFKKNWLRCVRDKYFLFSFCDGTERNILTSNIWNLFREESRKLFISLSNSCIST